MALWIVESVLKTQVHVEHGVKCFCPQAVSYPRRPKVIKCLPLWQPRIAMRLILSYKSLH
jgi:hypothetical protein